MRIAAEMLDYGADIAVVNEMEKYNRKTLSLFAEMSDGMLYDSAHKILYGTITDKMIAEHGVTYHEATSLIQLMKLIQGTSVCVLFIVSKKRIFVKSRAMIDIDLAKVMRTFGGGGHRCAAGACCYNDNTFAPYAVENKIINAIKKEIDSLSVK